MLKRSLVKFFICGLLILIIDRLLGIVMINAVENAKNGTTYEYNYTLFKAKPGIVVLGSSRAQHHYNPAIMQQDLGHKTINYGLEYSGVYFYYIVLKTLLQHYTPRLVVVDINHDEFENTLRTSRVSTLYPLLNKMHMDDSDLIKISPYEKYRLFFYTYRFNNRFFEMLSCKSGPKEDLANFNGYVPLMPAKSNLQLLTTSTYSFDKASYQCLGNIIALCKSRNIPLIVCTSPFYYNLQYNATSV